MLQIKDYQFSPTLIPTIGMLIVCSTLASLGYWQLERAEEKRIIERNIHHAQTQQIVDLNEATLDSLLNKFYHSAEIKGRYDSQHQFLYDNRTYKGKPGYHVLTPFILENKSIAVLINRGWIPYQGSRDDIPDIHVDELDATVKGIIKEPSKSIVLSKAEPLGTDYPITLQSISLKELAENLNYSLLPVVIELDKAEPSGFIREWQPYYGKIDKHIAYAVQWFFMSLILFLIYLKMHTKKGENN